MQSGGGVCPMDLETDDWSIGILNIAVAPEAEQETWDARPGGWWWNKALLGLPTYDVSM